MSCSDYYLVVCCIRGSNSQRQDVGSGVNVDDAIASRMKVSGTASPIADAIVQGRPGERQLFGRFDQVRLNTSTSRTVNNRRGGRADRLLADDGFEDKQRLL